MTTITATKPTLGTKNGGIIAPQVISEDTEPVKVTKAKCLLPEERKTLQTGRNIAEAQRILTLKTARESAVEDILDLGQDVNLEEAVDELSNDSLKQLLESLPLKDGVSFALLPLEEGLFVTRDACDVEDLKLAAARAALKKYVTVKSTDNGTYYQRPGVPTDSSASWASIYSVSCSTLLSELKVARIELDKIKKQAGII